MAKEKGRQKLMFYVFYDKNDFVKCFGVAKDLVAAGFFRNERAVIECAYHQDKNRPGSVVKLPVPKSRRSVLNVNL